MAISQQDLLARLEHLANALDTQNNNNTTRDQQNKFDQWQERAYRFNGPTVNQLGPYQDFMGAVSQYTNPTIGATAAARNNMMMGELYRSTVQQGYIRHPYDRQLFVQQMDYMGGTYQRDSFGEITGTRNLYMNDELRSQYLRTANRFNTIGGQTGTNTFQNNYNQANFSAASMTSLGLGGDLSNYLQLLDVSGRVGSVGAGGQSAGFKTDQKEFAETIAFALERGKLMDRLDETIKTMTGLTQQVVQRVGASDPQQLVLTLAKMNIGAKDDRRLQEQAGNIAFTADQASQSALNDPLGYKVYSDQLRRQGKDTSNVVNTYLKYGEFLRSGNIGDKLSFFYKTFQEIRPKGPDENLGKLGDFDTVDSASQVPLLQRASMYNLNPTQMQAILQYGKILSTGAEEDKSQLNAAIEKTKNLTNLKTPGDQVLAIRGFATKNIDDLMSLTQEESIINSIKDSDLKKYKNTLNDLNQQYQSAPDANTKSQLLAQGQQSFAQMLGNVQPNENNTSFTKMNDELSSLAESMDTTALKVKNSAEAHKTYIEQLEKTKQAAAAASGVFSNFGATLANSSIGNIAATGLVASIASYIGSKLGIGTAAAAGGTTLPVAAVAAPVAAVAAVATAGINEYQVTQHENTEAEKTLNEIAQAIAADPNVTPQQKEKLLAEARSKLSKGQTKRRSIAGMAALGTTVIAGAALTAFGVGASSTGFGAIAGVPMVVYGSALTAGALTGLAVNEYQDYATIGDSVAINNGPNSSLAVNKGPDGKWKVVRHTQKKGGGYTDILPFSDNVDSGAVSTNLSGNRIESLSVDKLVVNQVLLGAGAGTAAPSNLVSAAEKAQGVFSGAPGAQSVAYGPVPMSAPSGPAGAAQLRDQRNLTGTVIAGSSQSLFRTSSEIRISDDLFGTRSFVDPSGKVITRLHGSIDFAAPEGTVINSLTGGTVSAVGTDSGWGNYVQVKFGDDLYVQYSHLKSPSSLKQGQTIKRGEAIGEEGSTGNSSGPHLDLRVIDRRYTYKDPNSGEDLPMFLDPFAVLGKSDLGLDPSTASGVGFTTPGTPQFNNYMDEIERAKKEILARGGGSSIIGPTAESASKVEIVLNVKADEKGFLKLVAEAAGAKVTETSSGWTFTIDKSVTP